MALLPALLYQSGLMSGQVAVFSYTSGLSINHLSCVVAPNDTFRFIVPVKLIFFHEAGFTFSYSGMLV